MFDKRLMQMCPESRKYIAGNITLQFIELCLSTVMILIIAFSVQKLYDGIWHAEDLVRPSAVTALTVNLPFSTAKYPIRTTYLASPTAKQLTR